MGTVAAGAESSGRGRMRSRVAAERYAWCVVGYNVLVIVWGAMVRATGSGAGCGNHWPLCNGQVIPVSPTLHTVIEFTHRSMTGIATFAVLGLLIATFRATQKGSAARVAAVASGVLLLNEALLGALLVKLGYVTGNQSLGRVVMLSVHLSNTLLLLAALTLTAVLLRSGRRRGEVFGARSRWRSTGVGTVALGLLATLAVGVSGSLAALGDTLFPSATLRQAVTADFATGSPWLIRVRWVHPASAVLAALFVVWVLRRAWGRRDWPGHLARVVAGLLVAQFALGLLDVVLLAPVWMQLLHLLGADLYWVALVSLGAGLEMAGVETSRSSVVGVGSKPKSSAFTPLTESPGSNQILP
ncbi:MAG: COX15/CtaA family protein [Acidobacteriaceae bacterium]